MSSRDERHSNRLIRVCLLQNNLPPYRIPLFNSIASDKAIDLDLLLMARCRPNYPQWKNIVDKLSIKWSYVPGLSFPLRNGKQFCVNPFLLFVLIRSDPDVIICSGFSAGTVWAMIYKLIFGKKIVIWSEATATTESFLSLQMLRTKLRRSMASKTDAFIDAGTLSRDYILSLLDDNKSPKFFRAYNSIESQDFFQKCESFKRNTIILSEFRSKFPRKNILFSGQLIPRKNISGLVLAYDLVVRKAPEQVGLIVLGQGPLRQHLESERTTRNLQNVFLEGFKDPDEYCKYFAVADVFVLLSIFDCNPLVIFEALAAGLPVVCSSGAGNAVDFVENGKNGFIVDPLQPTLVAERLLSILFGRDTDGMKKASRAMGRKANYADASKAFLDAAKELTQNPMGLL